MIQSHLVKTWMLSWPNMCSTNPSVLSMCACRYSFGTGVQVLPIPELMPFRLTRQMTGVLQPHEALAMLQAPCVLAMTALRSGKDILQVCECPSPVKETDVLPW